MGHAPSPTPRVPSQAFLDHRIKKGEVRNPSGKSGNGRAIALAVLDGMIRREHNQVKLRAAFQKEFNKDPCRFFLVYVAPLIPKEAKLSLAAGNGDVIWQSLLTTFPTQDKGVSTTPEVIVLDPSVVAVGGATGSDSMFRSRSCPALR